MWIEGESVQLSGLSYDDWIYREYTLAGIWPRSCPEWIDTDEISRTLRECARNERLPWEIDLP